MTDKTQALRDLLAAIEVGGELPRPLPFPVWQSALVLEAYRGSLDAAKALHEAVLPGWGWAATQVGANVEGPTEFYSDDATTPARAWLIAILKALIAQAEQ